jgi:hypothetical protein
VQVSWNAALRTAQPEAKALRFLCRLKAAVAAAADGLSAMPLSHVSVGAAAASGKATHQFGGTGRVSALAVTLPWKNALLSCFELARRHRAFVTTEAVAVVASYVCHTRPVEVLAVARSRETVVVHEVVGERDDENDDEWMYVLSKAGAAQQCAALSKCVEGRYADAIAELDAVPGADAPPLASPARRSALVAGLRERAEAALLLCTPAASFAAAACACGVQEYTCVNS